MDFADILYVHTPSPQPTRQATIVVVENKTDAQTKQIQLTHCSLTSRIVNLAVGVLMVLGGILQIVNLGL